MPTPENCITLSWPIWDDAALCVQTLGFMRMLLGANEVHALYAYGLLHFTIGPLFFLYFM